MRSRALSQQLRRDICQQLLIGPFDDSGCKIVQLRRVLADKLYRRLYPKKTVLEQMLALPSGWLPEEEYISVEFDGEYAKMCFDGHPRGLFLTPSLQGSLETSERRRFQANDAGRSALEISSSDPLFADLLHVRQLKSALVEEHDKLRSEIGGILAGCSNTAALFDRWPEIRPVVEKLIAVEPAPIANLPAPILTALNKKLNLQKAA